MSDESIKRKDLWATMNNVRQNDWIKAAETLGIVVRYGKNGSHFITLRDPEFMESRGVEGLITVVVEKLFKESNRKIFKSILKYGETHGISEDDIWEALKLLK